MATITMARGNSATAEYLDQASQDVEQYFHQSIAFGKLPAFNELITLWEECNIPNWDGYNAFPVQAKTLYYAYLFVEALPLGYPLPSVGAEADGHLTLEWYRHPRWILSVSISPEADLYYAALFGNSDVHGSEPFLGSVPHSVLNLIQRVNIS